MPTNEIILTVALAAFLLGLAVYFLVRQRQAFAAFAGDATLADDDRRYLHAQARRRVICSVLLVILAGFLLGWIFIAPELPDTAKEQVPAGPREPTPQERAMLRGVTYYVIAGLLVLFVMLILAALDLISTARFGLRHSRQLVDERRSVIEQEIERLKQIRRERNGQ